MVLVLVVEDTDSERELICSYLQDGGYTTSAAANGAEALAKLEELKPDVIITDLVMPDMSGLELCRNIRKNPLTKAIPMIACTSKNNDLDKLWGMKQGINIYITKPFNRDDILSAVKSATGGK
jgi:two-component system, chemotaxis family, response regulator PixH